MTTKLYFEYPNLNHELFDKIVDETKEIGYYNLPDVNVDGIYEKIKKFSDKKYIVVVGIGGSSLGTYAVYNFLKSVKKINSKLYFLESTDPIVLRSVSKKIDFDDAVFLIISKSGTTVETISVFKYLLSKKQLNSDSYVIISDTGSPLHNLAVKNDITYFEIPQNVGGRFSVLSNVGLVPLAMIGVDIQKLLFGAKLIKDDFFAKGDMYNSLMNKAFMYAKNSHAYDINCLFGYSESFRGFSSWYVQLWGESLGKKQLNSELHVGLTPVGLIGPTDQHSFLQLIVEGKRDKSVTFLKVKNFDYNIEIPDITIEFLEKMDFVNNHNFAELINKQADSIIESLINFGDIPLDIIEIEHICEETIGELFYYYELLTSMVAKLIDVNAYDQPGVEDGKKILRGYFN